MRKLITALLLCISSSAFAQLNYVLNGDFEDYSFCPYEYDQIRAANHWYSLDTNNTSSVPGIPEYCNVCAGGTGFQVSLPSNGYGHQYPRSGDGLAQIVAFFDESVVQPEPYYRDYLQGRLYKKLIAGKSYCVTFYVNLVEASAYAIKEVSAYLDNGRIDTTKSIALPQTKYTPQVSNTGGIITDTANWTKIQDSFVANGTEQFITIGNFKDKVHTTYNKLPANGFNNSFDIALYLIDDVSVIESDLKAEAGQDRPISIGDSTYIGRPKEASLECTWTKLGGTAIIGTGAGIWVKPATTTSYVVTQTLCGLVKKDTVRIEVTPVEVNSISAPGIQSYTLSLNPNDGSMQLWQAVRDTEPVQVSVYNALGAVVYSGIKTFGGKAAAVDIGEVSPGMYYMVLRDSAGAAYILKFIKQ